MGEASVKKGLVKGFIKLTLILGAGFIILFLLARILPPPTEDGYRFFPLIGSRVWVWVIAQIHLNFAAFVLGVPMFAVAMEFIGWKRSDERLDRIAYDFTKLFTLAYTLTAIMGSILLISLPVLYPKFTAHMVKILGPTWWVYIAVMYCETFICYYYFYSWQQMKERKGLHTGIGVLLNLFGIFLLLVTSSWIGYMTTPGGVNEAGELVNRWEAIKTYMWLPLSLHRVIANVIFGAGIAAAYAAYRFIAAETDEERAYYDWMGYTSAMIAIGFFLILPGIGYLLGIEIYSFNEQMGIQLMGGFFAWLWVMQAILIGAILFFINYYLWISLQKMPGGERYFKYVKFLFIIILLGYTIWLTPHSVALSLEEARRIGAYHPVLGNLGVMAAKITAAILSLLATFLSFAIFRMSNKEPVVPWAKSGNIVRFVIIFVSSVIVLAIGVYSYMVPSAIRVKVLSPIQFGVFFLSLIALYLLDTLMYKGARIIGEPRWGRMPERSQYALIAITVTFTWLMGMMGYMRSGGRQYWHVYGIVKDTSPDAYLPTHGTASVIVTIGTILFFLLVAFVFWSIMKLEKITGGMGTRRATLNEAKASLALSEAKKGGKEMKGPVVKLGFVVIGLSLFFTYVGLYFLPQSESHPPKIIRIEEGISQEELITIGETIVFGKGQCMVCHAMKVETGMRAPAISTIGAQINTEARERGVTPEDHVFEALVNPANYVAKGFPPIMPAVNRPPMSLTEGELIAVAAFLQSNGGKVVVSYPASLGVLKTQIEKAGGK